MQSNLTLAPVIRKLDSTLRDSIALSIGMKLAARTFGLVEKYNTLKTAEAKFGRAKINPETGEPVTDALLRDIETVAGFYAAAMDAFPEQCYIVRGDGGIMGFGPEAYSISKATPFVRTQSDDELAVIAKAARTTTAAVQANQWKAAEVRADAFSRKAPALLAEVDAYVAMAPDADLEDIPEDLVEFHEVIETACKKYRAAVAAGKKWDTADLVLFNEDADYLSDILGTEV